jgi:hypothetical protein
MVFLLSIEVRAGARASARTLVGDLALASANNTAEAGSLPAVVVVAGGRIVDPDDGLALTGDRCG